MLYHFGWKSGIDLVVSARLFQELHGSLLRAQALYQLRSGYDQVHAGTCLLKEVIPITWVRKPLLQVLVHVQDRCFCRMVLEAKRPRNLGPIGNDQRHLCPPTSRHSLRDLGISLGSKDILYSYHSSSASQNCFR